jgi:hypothetical protein
LLSRGATPSHHLELDASGGEQAGEGKEGARRGMTLWCSAATREAEAMLAAGARSERRYRIRPTLAATLNGRCGHGFGEVSPLEITQPV